MNELGCPVCREGVYSGGEPLYITATSPSDLLYRCTVCRTWWVGDSRYAKPVNAQEAHGRFPEQVPA